MNITLNLTMQEEANLRRRAARAGLTAEDYLRRTLEPKQRKSSTRGISAQKSTDLSKDSYSAISEDQRRSLGESLLKFAGTWVGDDLEDCLAQVYATRSQAKF